jgi:hypothetical protein
MENTPEFESQRKDACIKLYSNNLEELLECYDGASIEYSIDMQI